MDDLIAYRREFKVEGCYFMNDEGLHLIKPDGTIVKVYDNETKNQTKE